MSLKEDLVIEEAIQILDDRLRKDKLVFTWPEDTKSFLVLQLAELEQEVFSILFLDNRHRMLEFETMFYGSIDGASVHPREVLKKTMKYNASALILAHNHPSGVCEPSQSDIRITQKLTDILKIVNVRILDHIIV